MNQPHKTVTIKTPEDIEILRKGGKRLARILDRLMRTIKAGVTTEEIDVLAERLIRDAGGAPAFKGYVGRLGDRPFSTTICASINDEVVHAPAVPSRIIKPGDVVKIDIGMRYPAKDGLYTDMARTTMVPGGDKIVRYGETAVRRSEVEKLIKATAMALKLGIKQVRAGRRVSHISKAVEKHIDAAGFGIVRDLVGHGVGYEVHEPPEIPNFWQEGLPDCVLQEGMVLAIEPMVNLGTWRVKVQPDGWTIATSDGSPAAHFEHTVLVTKRGCEVVTR